MSSITKIELLSPAKDLACGIAAINCGADAVYIGGPKFGARKAASNSLNEIAQLIKYAHFYNAKVYTVINTILYDDELKAAEESIKELYNMGADAIIIQDMGILEMDLPPIPLFASTQTNNYSVDRIKFLENSGLQRIILARELSLKQIRDIKKETTAELEFFIHGALCVSYSGQCYFSQSTKERSANRGECSQSCRMLYSLEDENGNLLVKDKYLLSLKDLNLSESLHELLEAGITSFKIEGRLKDADYVSNVTSFYRKKLDEILEGRNEFKKSSSGRIIHGFEPDPDKTFNRGYTDYFVKSKTAKIASFNTPKSTGEYIGKIISTGSNYIEISSGEKLNTGDGICCFDKDNNLIGFYINKIEGNRVYNYEAIGLKAGQDVYRNFNNKFNTLLAKLSASRSIELKIEINFSGQEFYIKGTDEDNNTLEKKYTVTGSPADNTDALCNIVIKQMKKTGESRFYIDEMTYTAENPVYLPVSKINELRREFLSEFHTLREKNHKREIRQYPDASPSFYEEKLDYQANVVNHLSKEFYLKAGVKEIEDGFELHDNYAGKKIMTCKYCIKKELDICPVFNKVKDTGPLYLKDKSRRYKLEFDCNKCEMSILFPAK